MSADSVDSDQYVDGSIDSAHIGDDQVDSQHYAGLSIDTEHIAADQVTTEKMTMTIPLTLTLPITLANRGGLNSDGVLYGTITHGPVGYAFALDGAVYADDTTDMNSAGAGDVDLLPATEEVGDAFFFGADTAFAGIVLNISQAGVVAGSAPASITWEYSDGAGSWANLESGYFLVDDSASFTTGTDTYVISFFPPADWVAAEVDSQSAFWVRARCAVADFTTQPVATQGWLLELDAGAGFRSTVTGTIDAIQLEAVTNSATNNDSEFILCNITAGTWDGFTWTGGDAHDLDATVNLAVTKNDQLAILMLQEDGTTEFANCNFIFEVIL
jgi:hypothetical protein